jgi:hypothetical protein
MEVVNFMLLIYPCWKIQPLYSSHCMLHNVLNLLILLLYSVSLVCVPLKTWRQVQSCSVYLYIWRWLYFRYSAQVSTIFFFDDMNRNGHISGRVKDPVTDYKWVRNFDSLYWGSSCILAIR